MSLMVFVAIRAFGFSFFLFLFLTSARISCGEEFDGFVKVFWCLVVQEIYGVFYKICTEFTSVIRVHVYPVRCGEGFMI